MTIDKEMLTLQKRIERARKGRMIGLLMIAATAGAVIELIILSAIGVI